MSLWILFVRTVLIYFTVFIIMRVMGKREIGKLSTFDLVISIMIAEIAVFVIEDTAKPLMEGLFPMITLVVIQVVLAYITLKNQTVRNWFDGSPAPIIERGKLNRKEMKKQRYNLDDLMVQLRENKIHDIANVEFAYLENSGKLSVVEKTNEKQQEKQERRASDSPRIRYEGLPLPLIMDGKVQDQNLQKIGQTRFWLKNEIQQKGVTDFKDIFFCTIDHRGYLYIDKNKKKG
ncbi:MAG: hypothetical protein A2189_03705 [Paenibacillus sp. RIFOXYA1_FULL_44_5]|nr:MAG: hypothetical protein A2189_03705 [Paenibacillus sp. RIFOXYA1_FULL_44_5]